MFGSNTGISTITSIEPCGIQAVWDITVEQDHSYCAQGLIHHNSSDSPNLQNFPKRDDEAKEVRKAIAAALGVKAKGAHKGGDTILSFDYGQIEARVIAMFTKDKLFCKALWERYDVHMEWAQRIAKSYPDRVGGSKMLTDKKAMKDFRTDIKNQWTFPLFFGAKLESAAGYLHIPVDKVRPHYNEFWRQFAGVKAWQEEQLKFYQKYGYVECLTGRRRYGPLTVNRVFNTPVQGTAAEIVMDAMCRLSESGDPELQPEINVHDDLTFLRVKKKRAEEVAEKILNVLLAVPFPWVNVPVTVELSHGPNWMELTEVGAFSSDEWFAK
jgi:DNA polymerase I-like protein with 3'-5' exonuclease and polymerase domains